MKQSLKNLLAPDYSNTETLKTIFLFIYGFEDIRMKGNL